ncbi:MAG TPA: hypothetical protein VJ949_02980 [Cryomorphaceae bacterium]|nr:hypothetical protein [Cryomorphaceae bacterium]
MKHSLSILLCFALLTAAAQEPQAKNAIFEAIKSGTLKLGSYNFYQDFLANSPSTIDAINLGKIPRENSPWSRTFEVNPRYASSGKKVKKVWGFSDGSTVYIWHQVEFFPIVIEQDELVFYGYDIIETDGATTAGIVGGAIGGGIYAAAQLSKAKKKKIRYTIEPKGGAPIHPQYGMNANKVEDPVRDLVVYRRKKKELEASASFTVNDSLKYSFVPNSNVRIRFPDSVRTVKVCTGPDFDQCVQHELENDATRYVKIEWLDEQENVRAFEVTDSKGEFDYYKTLKDQDKRGPQKAERL